MVYQHRKAGVMRNNQIIRTLRLGDQVKLTTLDGRVFTGKVTGIGCLLLVDFFQEEGNGITAFTIRASRLNRCLGTLEVVPEAK